MAGAAAAVTQTVLSATGCKAEATATAATAQAAIAPDDLLGVLGPCTTVGEVCLTHCLRRLAQGDGSLGECAMRVREMLAVCRVTETLAAAGSEYLSQAAALCADVCESCRLECEKHASHHRECAECAKACAAVIPLAKAVAQA